MNKPVCDDPSFDPIIGFPQDMVQWSSEKNHQKTRFDDCPGKVFSNRCWIDCKVYCEDIDGDYLVYWEPLDDSNSSTYILRRFPASHVMIESAALPEPTKDRQKYIDLINSHRASILQRKLDDSQWSVDDLMKECERLNLK